MEELLSLDPRSYQHRDWLKEFIPFGACTDQGFSA